MYMLLVPLGQLERRGHEGRGIQLGDARLSLISSIPLPTDGNLGEGGAYVPVEIISVHC
jgi:hypothetical protein